MTNCLNSASEQRHGYCAVPVLLSFQFLQLLNVGIDKLRTRPSQIEYLKVQLPPCFPIRLGSIKLVRRATCKTLAHLQLSYQATFVFLHAVDDGQHKSKHCFANQGVKHDFPETCHISASGFKYLMRDARLQSVRSIRPPTACPNSDPPYQIDVSLTALARQLTEALLRPPTMSLYVVDQREDTSKRV